MDLPGDSAIAWLVRAHQRKDGARRVSDQNARRSHCFHCARAGATNAHRRARHSVQGASFLCHLALRGNHFAREMARQSYPPWQKQYGPYTHRRAIEAAQALEYDETRIYRAEPCSPSRAHASAREEQSETPLATLSTV